MELYIVIDDVNSFIYLIDFWNHNIQIFDLDGNFKNFWGREGGGNGEFKQPLGIEYANGRIYISEAQNHRIQVFDARELAKK